MNHRRGVAPRGQAGFSLLEILVAFAIMAFGLVAVYRLVGGSLGAATTADETNRAVITAQSVLARHRHVPPGGLHEFGETPDGYSWQLQTTPHLVPPAGITHPVLHHVSVHVSWRSQARDRVLVLDTLLPEVAE